MNYREFLTEFIIHYFLIIQKPHPKLYAKGGVNRINLILVEHQEKFLRFQMVERQE